MEFMVAMVCWIARVGRSLGRGKQSVPIAIAWGFGEPGARTGVIFERNDLHPSGAPSGQHEKATAKPALHATSL